MEEIEDLSNDEIRAQLLRYGIIPGPITDTTRSVYKNKLKRVRESDDYQTPSLSPKRKKVESTPSVSSPSRQTRRRSASSPRLSRPRTPSPKPSAPPHPSLAMAAPSPLHVHHQASSSSSIDDSSVSIDASSSFAPIHHPKLACSQSDLQSVSKKKKEEPSGLDLASVFSSTVQSGIQFIGDSVKKLVNPILSAASPNSPIKNQAQRRNMAVRGSLFRGNYQPSPFRGNQSSVSRGYQPPSSKAKKQLVSQPPSSRINQPPSFQPSRIHQSPSRNNPPPSFQANRPSSSFAQFNSVEIGGEFEDETDGGSPIPSAPPPPLQHDYKYDWELAQTDVQICLRPDGTRWRLGKGGFGEVFKGLKDGVDEVAVKVIHLQSQENISLFKSEIDLISKLRHRHIVQFYGACIKPPCLYMVTELMNGDLFSALKKDIRYHWSGIFGHQVAEGIVSGLHYLHSRKPTIVHRDIKSPNVLLMDGMAKIADVGVARTKGPSDMTAQRGFTIAWAAPEVVYRRRATEKIDIWSFGIILWEIYTGRSPGPGQLMLPATASVDLRNLFSACTSEDPIQRPTAAQILLTLKDMI